MKRAVVLVMSIVAMLGFLALGVWQLERRAWKIDLIERVNARVHAAPDALPQQSSWSRVNVRDDEYRRVRVTGRWLVDRSTLVDALTERGAGNWILTPLAKADGVVLVNRGFVPSGQKSDVADQGTVTVTGLLRMPEPDGRFLRPNQPQADRWFSREVVAIAKARAIGPVAPFFIDSEAIRPGSYPIGGMTVVSFRNTHLIYALTWFALAGLGGYGTWRFAREES